MFVLYKIYYGDYVAYLGRTKQKINDRLRGHFFQINKMYRPIDIALVTKIEIAELPTQADMYIYEIYYINTLKPSLNSDDKALDDLTVMLPELKWENHWPHLMDKWKMKLHTEKMPIRNAKKQKISITERNVWKQRN